MRIIIDPIPEHLGGGFVAYVEGYRYFRVGDGETQEEALTSLLKLERALRRRKDGS